MITPWLPIVVTAVRVVGRHPRQPDCVVVRFELDRRPPSRWLELFAAGQSANRAERPDDPVPQVQDGLVQVNAREVTLDQDVADVMALLDATNHWFQAELRGATANQPEWRQLSEDDARLEAARARALKMSRQLAQRHNTSMRWQQGVAPQPIEPPGKRER